MTADSQRKPRAATRGGRPDAVAISASVLSSSRSSTRRSAGLSSGGGERLDRAALGREIVQRHIDAVEIAVIVGAVLQMIEDLQRGAQRVRSRPGVAALAVQVEQLPADRRGGIAAIFHQIVPVAVAQLDRVLAERVQHVVAMLSGDPGRGEAGAHRGRGRRIRRRGAPSRIAAIRSSRRIFSSADKTGLSAISSALRAKR